MNDRGYNREETIFFAFLSAFLGQVLATGFVRMMPGRLFDVLTVGIGLSISVGAVAYVMIKRRRNREECRERRLIERILDLVARRSGVNGRPSPCRCEHCDWLRERSGRNH